MIILILIGISIMIINNIFLHEESTNNNLVVWNYNSKLKLHIMDCF